MPHRKLRERKHFTLRRDLGLLNATAAGVGIILGAGIYVLIGAASGMAGNALWMSFLIAAIVAIFTGLSYAELSSMFPKDAGEYVYTEHAFGKKIAFIIGYAVILTGIIAAAAVAIGFSGYFSKLMGLNTIVPIAIAVIAFFSLINYCGIKQSARLNLVFSFFEVAGLLAIIFLSAKFIGSVNYLDMANGLNGVFEAASLIFFAFIGFEAVVKLSEETKNPTKVIPKALMLSIAISTVLYVLVAVSAVSVLDWSVLAQSSAPLADVAAAVLGSKAFVILAIIAMISTANTILIDLIATSRTLYGIAGEYKLLRAFTVIHPKTRTPWLSILFIFLLTIPFVLIEKIHLIAEITNFSVFVTFGIINASLIWLRYKEPKAERPFKIPLTIGKFPILPLIGLLTCLFMITNLQPMVILAGIGLFTVGFLIYLVAERFEKR